MKNLKKYKAVLGEVGYYVYALCEISGEQRTPFYIGKGKNDRCLKHLESDEDDTRSSKVKVLSSQNRLGIDIIRHGIKTDREAKLIEATCIDLLGVGNLTNKVRGSGVDMGRVSLEEIYSLRSGKTVKIKAKHAGIAFLLNSTYKSGMSELALFEATRGVWRNVKRDEDIKFAYATYGGLIKEVYQIHGWVPAGTQQYFEREFTDQDVAGRWEFIGKKANQEVREAYLGKILEKDRSWGSPFVYVG
jgi:uncharacterized protein